MDKEKVLLARTKNIAMRVILRAELASPITLIHNDLFPVANVRPNLYFGFEYIMNRLQQNINSLPLQTQLAGHLHWHGSNSLFIDRGRPAAVTVYCR